MQRHSVTPARLARRNCFELGITLAISAICSGRTNMPLTLVVWLARPIQPLIRILVRRQGLWPGSEVSKREANPAMMEVRRGHDDLADIGLGDGIAGWAVQFTIRLRWQDAAMAL